MLFYFHFLYSCRLSLLNVSTSPFVTVFSLISSRKIISLFCTFVLPLFFFFFFLYFALLLPIKILESRNKTSKSAYCHQSQLGAQLKKKAAPAPASFGFGGQASKDYHIGSLKRVIENVTSYWNCMILLGHFRGYYRKNSGLIDWLITGWAKLY